MGSGQPGSGRLAAPASPQALALPQVLSSAGNGLTVPPCQLPPLVSASCERQPSPPSDPCCPCWVWGLLWACPPAVPLSPPWGGWSAWAPHGHAGRGRQLLQSCSPSSSRWGGQWGRLPHRCQPGAPSPWDGQQGPGRGVTSGPLLLRGAQAPGLDPWWLCPQGACSLPGWRPGQLAGTPRDGTVLGSGMCALPGVPGVVWGPALPGLGPAVAIAVDKARRAGQDSWAGRAETSDHRAWRFGPGPAPPG